MSHPEEETFDGSGEEAPKVKLNAKGKVRTSQTRKRKKKPNKPPTGEGR
jgi:hypothetical protein